MGDWLDLHAVCVNEWMSRKCLENGLSYNVYVHYTPLEATQMLWSRRIINPSLQICVQFPRATGRFPWDSAPAERLKTADQEQGWRQEFSDRGG